MVALVLGVGAYGVMVVVMGGYEMVILVVVGFMGW